MTSNVTPAILLAALEGLSVRKAQIEEQMTAIRAQLQKFGVDKNYKPAVAGGHRNGHRKPRNLSPEARERIAAAQRKRWAAYRGSAS